MDQNGWFRLEAGRQKRKDANFNRPRAVPQEPVRPKVTSLPVAPVQPASPAPAPEPTVPEPSAASCPEEHVSAVHAEEAPPCPETPIPVPGQKEAVPAVTGDPHASQTAGARGPVLWQDSVLHETLSAFVHRSVHPRVLHAKGFGAFGTFCPYQSMADYTTLTFLQSAERSTPVTARFSLALSTRGTPDTARNIRGFSVKFFSSDGVFDLLCNHLPVFLVRDAMRFPEAIQSFRPSPVNNLPDANQFWSFVAGAPESVHFLTWLYSDEGTIQSFRHMRGYSVNTYVWVNRESQRRFVKYHWFPLAGPSCITAQEARQLAGESPDVAGQDLYQTIAAGTPVEFELRVQLMDPQLTDSLSYDPLDCTKLWSEADFPPLPVGKLTLDRNPSDYDRQIEPLAFSPANLLPGAELSADKLLQGRANIYWDAQRSRLGPAFRSLPANGQGNWCPHDLVTSGQRQEVCGPVVRTPTPLGDDFAQAGERYRSLSPEQQEHLVSNLADDLVQVRDDLRCTVLGYFKEADPELARRLAERCGK